jgi:hypothetical protein
VWANLNEFIQVLVKSWFLGFLHLRFLWRRTWDFNSRMSRIINHIIWLVYVEVRCGDEAKLFGIPLELQHAKMSSFEHSRVSDATRQMSLLDWLAGRTKWPLIE